MNVTVEPESLHSPTMLWCYQQWKPKVSQNKVLVGDAHVIARPIQSLAVIPCHKNRDIADNEQLNYLERN